MSNTLRNEAMSLYKPPFRYFKGYIFDSANNVFADDGGTDETIVQNTIARIRGWGKLGYHKNGAELQDELGNLVAEALNKFYEDLDKPLEEGPPGSGGWEAYSKEMEHQSTFYRKYADTLIRYQKNDYWCWQGDGADNLDSMASDLPVVIRASQLRELLAASKNRT